MSASREWLARLTRLLHEQRLRTARAEALPQLAVLSIACGLLVAVVMIAFRTLIELAQTVLLPPGGPENYEALTASLRFVLPIAGAFLIAGLFWPFSDTDRNVGVVHVLERLAYHQARLPFRNAVLQFLGAAMAIIAGMSVGREGPAIHLGAASASVAGQRMGLPNNSLRVLVACGVAAAIAASFNTPLAGVVFAMEVVLMEYTVIGFAPVILAAVSATALTHLAYGDAPAFSVPPLTLVSLWELPYILGLGILVGLLSAGFVALVDVTTRRTRGWPFLLRMVAAGAVTGTAALHAPQIMGVGYDTVGAALLGEVSVTVLLGIVVLKLLASGISIGLSVPGGLIGPVVVIGAAAGGAFGFVGQWLAPVDVSSPGLYALVGLGAMLAGTLHAPLAALTAMLELTRNPNVIWPGMLATIAAYGVSRALFGQQPVFVTLLRARGLDYRNDPVAQSLRRISVGATMDLAVVVLPRKAERSAIDAALARAPAWVLITGDNGPAALLPAVDLARQALERTEAETLDLMELPGDRLQVAPIPLGATLQEALDAMNESEAEALYVQNPTPGGVKYGILTRVQVEAQYRYSR